MEKISRPRLGIIAQFANYHIRSAVHFADLCRHAEEAFKENKGDVYYFQHRAYVTGAIMLSIAFLEAAINELIVGVSINVIPWNEGDIEKSKLNSLSQRIEDVKYINTLDKYQFILSFMEKNQFELGRNPFQDASSVVKLRNKLIHFEPEHIFPIAPESEDEEHKWVKKLKHKFPVNPIAKGMNRLNYPDILLGYGCARWAVVSIINFHDEFCSRIKLPGSYSKLINELPSIK